jgi:outer membrane receptor for ferrienterochelin and colicins
VIFVALMRILALFVLIVLHSGMQAQKDSIHLDEVIITATKTQRSLASLPMQVTVIKSREIAMTGTSRLQDILAEQNGLTIVPQINGFGNGLQMQGLNPDYTMILIDGEPLIGRLTGNLELNRVTLANIRKIEIVKGPSSSLYGSEALGGVVNIITKSPEYNKLQLGLKYATHQTMDASIDANYLKGKWSLSIFGNHFRTNGFDLFPEIFGQTVSPYNNTTFQFKTKYEFNEKHILQLSGKAFYENQDNLYQVVSGQDSIKVSGTSTIRDFSLNPYYKIKLGEKVYVSASVYGSVYHTDTRLIKNETAETYYTDTFQQSFIRPELQTSCYYSKNQKWTAGLGIALESVETSRYADAQKRDQNTKYIFAQHEWSLHKKWELVSGLRYDDNTIYGSQWSPKLAVQYSLNDKLKLKTSVGTGFKSPDFRYLYLNFRNAAAGYSVFGTNELKSQIDELTQKGEILQLLYDINSIGKLSAEKSFAINAGFQFHYLEDCHIDFNFFRNDLDGLIESQAIALTKDLKTIYSYANIKKAFTQGFEFGISHRLIQGLQIDLTSQILYAKDKEVLNNIDAGLLFGRDPVTKESYRITKSDYFGLYNRSRHTETIKLFYENARYDWNASLRVIYKSKFGISATAGSVQGTIRPSSDINGNAILDRYDSFVDGYFLCNASIAKTLYKTLTIQFGVENVLDYKDPASIPNLQGRVLFINMNYKLF